MLWVIYLYTLGIVSTVVTLVSAVTMWISMRRVEDCFSTKASRLQYTADLLFEQPVERPQSVILVSFQCIRETPNWSHVPNNSSNNNTLYPVPAPIPSPQDPQDFWCHDESYTPSPHVHRQTIERFHENVNGESLTSFTKHTMTLLANTLHANVILWIVVTILLIIHSMGLAASERYLRLVYSSSRTRMLLNIVRTVLVGIITSATAVGVVTLLMTTQLIHLLNDPCSRTEHAQVASYMYIVTTLLTQLVWTIEPCVYVDAVSRQHPSYDSVT